MLDYINIVDQIVSAVAVCRDLISICVSGNEPGNLVEGRADGGTPGDTGHCGAHQGSIVSPVHTQPD